MSASEHTARYIAAFKEWRSAAKSSAPSWLERASARRHRKLCGARVSNPQQEEWKYTNVEPVVSRQFGMANGEASFVGADIFSSAFVEADAPRLVFVNGVYAPALSSVQSLPQRRAFGESVRIASTATTAVLAARIGRYADHRRNAFVALNTAFMDDGAVVIVAPGCRLPQPIYLVYASGAKNGR